MAAEDWLRSTFDQTVQPAAGTQKPAQAPPKAEPVAEAPKEEEELPDWLKAAGPPVEPPVREEAVTPPVGEAEAPMLEPMKGFEEGEIPDWLREIAAGAPAAAPEAAPPAYSHV